MPKQIFAQYEDGGQQDITDWVDEVIGKMDNRMIAAQIAHAEVMNVHPRDFIKRIDSLQKEVKEYMLEKYRK